MSSLPDRIIPFREALRFWCKLGFISFGGPLTGFASAVALQRFKRSVLEFIGACAVAGLQLKLLTP